MEVHSKTNEFKDESNFESKLTEKLKNRSLDKVAIANILSEKIEKEDNLQFNNDEYITYLINAIKYACDNIR